METKLMLKVAVLALCAFTIGMAVGISVCPAPLQPEIVYLPAPVLEREKAIDILIDRCNDIMDGKYDPNAQVEEPK